MIVIVDYGMGNLGSIANMLKKVGAEATVTSERAIIERADKIILAGVGTFDYGMRNLAERGLTPVLQAKVQENKTPILGLCLGMQLFTQRSEEGQLPGLGWLEAETVRFRFGESLAHLKVPHMGWNTVQICQPHRIFAQLEAESRFYFVHSYHLKCADPDLVVAQANHGYDFPCAVAKDNVVGVQFHPEKSHKYGMKLLQAFAEHDGHA